MTLPIVLFLGKRVASAALCIALVGAAVPGALRGELSAHNGPEALAFERAAAVPVALQGYRSWPLVGLSGRHGERHELHAVVSGASGTIEVGGQRTRLCQSSTSVAPLPLVSARSERGPPHHTLS